MIAERCHWCGLHNGVHQHGCPNRPQPVCPYIVGDTTKHCALAERALPPHEHIRDELAAVIQRSLDEHYIESDDDVRTVANRCVHVLVLLGVLPEVNE